MRISGMVGCALVRSPVRQFCSRSTATEFRRHREVTNPVHVMGFLTQWKIYLDELPHDPSAKNFRKLDPTVFEKVNLRMCFATVTNSLTWYSSFRCLESSWDNYTSSCMRRKVFGSPSTRMHLTQNMANHDGISSQCDLIYAWSSYVKI